MEREERKAAAEAKKVAQQEAAKYRNAMRLKILRADESLQLRNLRYIAKWCGIVVPLARMEQWSEAECEQYLLRKFKESHIYYGWSYEQCLAYRKEKYNMDTCTHRKKTHALLYSLSFSLHFVDKI